MTTALVRRELTPDVWGMIQQIAPTMKDSRFFGVATPQQAMAIMLKGYELGLGLAASFEFIQPIQEKPTLSPRGALALIIQSGECIKLEIRDIRDAKGEPDRCEVTMKRKNGIEYSSSFSMADARRAGLVKPDSGWVRYPQSMLKWRSVGFCADVVFPDLLGGLKKADELGADITQDGNIIDTTWTRSPNTGVENGATGHGVKSTAAAVDPQNLLSALVQDFGAEKVLVANGGTIPSTYEEIEAARLTLERTMETEIVEILQGETVAA